MVTLSQKEFQGVKVIENAVAGRLRVSEAAGLLQRSERQAQRLKRRYRPDSVAWVHHGNRGRPMPWALPAALRRTILELARGQYQGFNDSSARCTPWSPLMACPSASTATATASFTATIPTGPWPNNSLENSAPPN
jgi:hypothetical protein